MDLIYADETGKDIGVLKNYMLDLRISIETKSNNFELKMPLKGAPLKAGFYIYIEDTEYGGRIDAVKIDTSEETAYFSGRTWRGILGSKIIEPSPGEPYYIVNGNATEVLAEMVEKLKLTGLFAISGRNEINIVGNQFARYIDGHKGIIKMLSKVGGKLLIRYNSGKVVLSAVKITDHSSESEITSDLFDFTIEKTPLCINHMIGLGRGELTERQVIHRYMDNNGNVTPVQHFTGMDEITDIYDNSNCESQEELEAETEEELFERAVEDGLKITAYDLAADLGDKFTATDIDAGISVTQYVTDKIVQIDRGITKIFYEVGAQI